MKFQPNFYSICKITDFIDEHRRAFDKLLNEEYEEGYRPMDYEPFNKDDELFADVYIDCFMDLINGYWSERCYKKLYEYLTEERGKN